MALTPGLGQQPDENTYTELSAVQADRVILPVLDDGERCEMSLPVGFMAGW